ncbi:right-handed parallel beta-helix repeat-containing protein, partial [Deinococcus sp. 12RED42]|uniref:right-handed parallel beta-helix repeat-containing protein n=1 Tax=Deinococcus sp. 12RED42 TaxID=2745872 RepID=UPI001E2C51B3
VQAAADNASNQLRAMLIMPEMYGAVGDGTADDTVAISAAIAAAGGRTLILAGRYLINPSQTIAIPPAATLRWMPTGELIVPAAAALPAQPGTGNAYLLALGHNVRLESPRIRGTLPATLPARSLGAVIGYFVSAPQIIDPDISGFTGPGIVLSGAPGWLIERGRVSNCGRSLGNPARAQGGVTVGTYEQRPGDPWYGGGTARGLTVTGSGLDGILVDGVDVTIEGGAYNGNGVDITTPNPDTGATGAAGVFAQNTRNLRILNVTVSGNTGNGVDMMAHTGPVNHQPIISGVVADRNGASGIQVDGAYLPRVLDCVCSNNGQGGATQTQRDGITIASSERVTGAIVRGCRLYDDQGAAATQQRGVATRINVSSDIDGLEITDNVIYGNVMEPVGSANNPDNLVTAGQATIARNGTVQALTRGWNGPLINRADVIHVTPTAAIQITSLIPAAPGTRVTVRHIGTDQSITLVDGPLLRVGGTDLTLTPGQSVRLEASGDTWWRA